MGSFAWFSGAGRGRTNPEGIACCTAKPDTVPSSYSLSPSSDAGAAPLSIRRNGGLFMKSTPADPFALICRKISSSVDVLQRNKMILIPHYSAGLRFITWSTNPCSPESLDHTASHQWYRSEANALSFGHWRHQSDVGIGPQAPHRSIFVWPNNCCTCNCSSFP